MAKITFSEQVAIQRRKIPPIPSKDLSGKTVVVVGANTGLGFEAANHFATLKPGRLIITARNQKKGDDAVAAIKTATGFKNVEFWLLDLSNFASVSDFATRYEKDGGRLDMLVMNAGVHAYTHEISPEGYESNMQINHLSTSLLPILLTPTMLATAQRYDTTPRIVLVSSVLAFRVELPQELLAEEMVVEKLGAKEWSGLPGIPDRYYISKLFNIFFARAYAQHLVTTPTQSIEAVSVAPGFCASSLGRDMTLTRQLIVGLARRLLAHSIEEGSRMLVRAAVCDAEELEPKAKCGNGGAVVLNGAYLAAEEITEISDFALSAEGAVVQENMWKDTLRIVSKADPRVAGIVADLFTA